MMLFFSDEGTIFEYYTLILIEKDKFREDWIKVFKINKIQKQFTWLTEFDIFSDYQDWDIVDRIAK